MDYRLRAAETLGLRDQSSLADLIDAVNLGFEYGAVARFCEAYCVPRREIASAMGISPSTLGRRRSAGRISASESERLLRLASLYAMAEDVVGDRVLAAEWMRTPARGLDGRQPTAYARTEPGARQVEILLGRIAYGVVA